MSTWALGGLGARMDRCRETHLSDLLSMTTPLGAGRGGGGEEVTFWEEGTSHAGLARVLAEVGSLPNPSPLWRPGWDHGSGPWGNSVAKIVSLRSRPAFAECSQPPI